MFEVNDRSLRTVRVILNVWVWGGAIACIVCGIVLSALGMLAAGLPILFVGPFACWLSWVFGRLYLCYLCDVKLIRNKLYGEDNEGLAVFLGDVSGKERQKPAATSVAAQVRAGGEEKADAFALLCKLHDKGVFSDEEFEEKRRMFVQDDVEHFDEWSAQAQREEEQDAASSLSVQERAEKLLRLKKQLDAGAVTQEEFDKEKEKLLNG